MPHVMACAVAGAAWPSRDTLARCGVLIRTHKIGLIRQTPEFHVEIIWMDKFNSDIEF